MKDNKILKNVPSKKADAPGLEVDAGEIFKRILVKAFKQEGIKGIDDIHQVLLWGVGEMYAYVPYQKWGDEIFKRHPEMTLAKGLDRQVIPAYIILRTLARLYVNKMKVTHIKTIDHKDLPKPYKPLPKLI